MYVNFVPSICTFLAESPQAMINTLWLYFTMGFGLRGRHEHEQLLWGDIALKVSSAGEEFLEFNERATKTRQEIMSGAMDQDYCKSRYV